MDGAEFGRQVRALMTQRGMGLRALAKAINYDPGYLSRVINGRKPPTVHLATTIDRQLQAGGHLVALVAVKEKTAASEQDLVAEVARQTREHSERAEATEVGASALEQLQADVVGLARAYVAEAPLPLFVEMVSVRDRIFRALSRKSHPRQTTELYLLVGALSALMANASLDLGRRKAGDEFARAAWTYGSIAAHSGLMAWARGTQALIAIADGRPDDAIRYAEEGLALQPAGMGGARLYSLSARALAGQPGMDERAQQILAQAKEAREMTTRSDLYDDLRGEFSFDEAKLYYYEAVTRVRIGDAKKASIAASAAISQFESRAFPDRSYGCESLARVQLALACLMSGELEGADGALAPVFNLSPEQRISSLTRQLAAGRRLLRAAEFRGSPRARTLDDRLNAFCGATVVPALARG